MGFFSFTLLRKLLLQKNNKWSTTQTSGFYSHLTSFITALQITGDIPNLSSELPSVLDIRELLEAKQTASVTEVCEVFTPPFFLVSHPGERQLVKEQIPNTQTEV